MDVGHIIYNQDKFTHLKPLMRDLNAFNVYQINILQALKSMYKAKHNLNTRVFNNTLIESITDTQQGFLKTNLNNQN